MRIDSLDELRVFVQVAESGSMAGAARALGMPANTVGRRIAALEDRLGVRLLSRTTRSVSLSEHGRAFIAQAHRVLEAAQIAENTLARQREGLAGRVRMGVPSLLTADVLAALRPLLLEHPRLRLELAIHDRPISPVQAGLDVVIIGGTLQDSSLVARRLAQVDLVLAASATYLETFGEPTDPQELTEHRTLHFRTNPPESSWTLTDRDGRQQVVPVDGPFEADDGRAVLDALRLGLGIGATSMRLVRAHPELRRVLPDHTRFSFPVFAIYPTSGQRSARLQTVVDTLQAVLS